MRYIKFDRFYCFSPAVMIATFIIELVLAFYTIVRYRLTKITRVAVGILVCLAVFQFAEYNVCEGSLGMGSLVWARIGYVAITALPPLGLHLIMNMTGRMRPRLLGAVYILASVFMGVFLYVGHGIEGQVCQGNYVIFSITSWTVIPYSLYYYGLIVMSMYYAIYYARHMSTKQTKNKKRALYAFVAGYLAFLIPTTTVNLIDPGTRSAIPSVMCGFAVIFAIILAGSVVPRYYSK